MVNERAALAFFPSVKEKSNLPPHSRQSHTSNQECHGGQCQFGDPGPKCSSWRRFQGEVDSDESDPMCSFEVNEKWRKKSQRRYGGNRSIYNVPDFAGVIYCARHHTLVG